VVAASIPHEQTEPERASVKWLFFLALAALSLSVRLLGQDQIDEPAGSALLSLGCLIIGAVLAGELAARRQLPRITGYLLVGMAIGPYALGLETANDAAHLQLFEELALGLIALTAGGELRMQGIGRRIKPLLTITACHTFGILLTVGSGMWALFYLRPFPALSSTAEMLAAAALCGAVAVAVSPSTTIAVITELHARGELTETVLGVTILKDLVILLLFTWVNVIAHSWVDDTPLTLTMLPGVAMEIVLSLVTGCFLGLLLGAFLARVGRHVELTVVLLALVSAELDRGYHVEHLLVCMAAGFTVRNLYPKVSTGFIEALQRSSTPIYIIFFALVGAGLNLKVFADLWVPAIVFVLLRAAMIWLFTTPPAILTRAGPGVVGYAWMGFVAQAGLSLGLAARIQREFGDLGQAVATLIVAAVVVNQLAGPVLWANAIRKSGEGQPNRDRSGLSSRK
jgi:Kef-type K+ transport system membrane component KefB